MLMEVSWHILANNLNYINEISGKLSVIEDFPLFSFILKFKYYFYCL